MPSCSLIFCFLCSYTSSLFLIDTFPSSHFISGISFNLHLFFTTMQLASLKLAFAMGKLRECNRDWFCFDVMDVQPALHSQGYLYVLPGENSDIADAFYMVQTWNVTSHSHIIRVAIIHNISRTKGGISLSCFTLKVTEVSKLLFLNFEGHMSPIGDCGFPQLCCNISSTQGGWNDAEVVL